MNLEMVLAAIQGYSDRLLDMQIIAVQSGYWSAYYSGTRHPKSIASISEEMVRKHRVKSAAKTASTVKPDVDVEAFLEKEAQFKARMKQQGR